MEGISDQRSALGINTVVLVLLSLTRRRQNTTYRAVLSLTLGIYALTLSLGKGSPDTTSILGLIAVGIALGLQAIGFASRSRAEPNERSGTFICVASVRLVGGPHDPGLRRRTAPRTLLAIAIAFLLLVKAWPSKHWLYPTIGAGAVPVRALSERLAGTVVRDGRDRAGLSTLVAGRLDATRRADADPLVETGRIGLCRSAFPLGGMCCLAAVLLRGGEVSNEIRPWYDSAGLVLNLAVFAVLMIKAYPALAWLHRLSAGNHSGGDGRLPVDGLAALLAPVRHGRRDRLGRSHTAGRWTFGHDLPMVRRTGIGFQRTDGDMVLDHLHRFDLGNGADGRSDNPCDRISDERDSCSFDGALAVGRLAPCPGARRCLAGVHFWETSKARPCRGFSQRLPSLVRDMVAGRVGFATGIAIGHQSRDLLAIGNRRRRGPEGRTGRISLESTSLAPSDLAPRSLHGPRGAFRGLRRARWVDSGPLAAALTREKINPTTAETLAIAAIAPALAASRRRRVAGGYASNFLVIAALAVAGAAVALWIGVPNEGDRLVAASAGARAGAGLWFVAGWQRRRDGLPLPLEIEAQTFPASSVPLAWEHGALCASLVAIAAIITSFARNEPNVYGQAMAIVVLFGVALLLVGLVLRWGAEWLVYLAQACLLGGFLDYRRINPLPVSADLAVLTLFGYIDLGLAEVLQRLDMSKFSRPTRNFSLILPILPIALALTNTGFATPRLFVFFAVATFYGAASAAIRWRPLSYASAVLYNAFLWLLWGHLGWTVADHSQFYFIPVGLSAILFAEVNRRVSDCRPSTQFEGSGWRSFTCRWPRRSGNSPA